MNRHLESVAQRSRVQSFGMAIGPCGRISAGLMCLVTAVLCVPLPAHSATLYVDRTDDDPSAFQCGFVSLNDCSLRGAIIHANGTPEHDTIHLPAGIYTLTEPGRWEDAAATGDLDIVGPTDIFGEWAFLTIIDANDIDRVLHVAAAVPVTIEDVTIRDGASGEPIPSQGEDGGGLLVSEAATVTLNRCAFISNTADDNSGFGIPLRGGGIALTSSGADVTIEDSSITANFGESGGGIFNESGTLTVRRSTLSANSAGGAIGGANGHALLNWGTTTLSNSTVSGHVPVADDDCVIRNVGTLMIDSTTLSNNAPITMTTSSTGTTTLRNNLIDGGCIVEAGGTHLTDGGNLESPGNTCGLGILELRNIPDPMLSALLPNGGPTMTHVPLEGSPAIDQPIATAGCLGEDQRGVDRPQDGDGNLDAVCDIGAVEVTGTEEVSIFYDGFESGDTTAWSFTTP
jgi:hypothetical protein